MNALKKQQLREAQLNVGFEIARTVKDDLYARWGVACDALNAFCAQFPRGPMNLTPDHVKAMPEFKTLNAECQKLETAYKDYASVFNMVFEKEYKAYTIKWREEKYAALAAKSENQQ